MKTKLLLALLVSLNSFGVVHGNYERMRESLAPVATECQVAEGVIVHEAVLINMYCAEHGTNGEMVQVKKRVIIDLVAKEWTRTSGRFELLD